ncbi:peptidoglycan editing factor PgeF [Corynebacterium sp. 13CS0277]|uniref:peptidoglycan editing factor PgeF n=1 Tax=Corynebacterium sp. 13CS0277 TaxID=2071994 RepID=UPI000D03D880|nr:peptidoglycan editing factor PgeF [Corynebacterium sp. 13CS0277]PRQ11156.1 peptidoglycan editing factor PgeF [Corynebacterium sp. 13CS0277]
MASPAPTGPEAHDADVEYAGGLPPEQRPVRTLYTNRHGGVSTGAYDSFNLGDHVGDDPQHVAANRARLARIADLPPERMVYMEQLHTNTVTQVDEPVGGPVPATDALVTTTAKLALVVLTADCVPVVFSDPVHGVVGAAHAGRLGARNGIVPRTVAAMQDLGARPETIHVLIGAAASGALYEVPEAMARDVEQHLPGSRVTTRAGTAGLDLRRGIVHQLAQLGIDNVTVNPECTITDDNYFSYRRQGTCGRQATLGFLTGAPLQAL